MQAALGEKLMTHMLPFFLYHTSGAYPKPILDELFHLFNIFESLNILIGSNKR